MRAMLLMSLAMFVSLSANALKLEKYDYPEKIKQAGKDLVLNGVGLRRASRFGLSFKVYTCGLYLTEKSSDKKQILNSKEPKYIRMDYLRRVDASDLKEGFLDAFSANCVVDCENSRKLFLPVAESIPDMPNESAMEFWFYPDRVEYRFNGRKDVKGEVKNEGVSKNLLAEWIGDKPVSQSLQDQILGLPAK
jgi:hypothetical protein